MKRAVAMIHEFYQTGITLDEIAMKMGITPEYLGTQFHQVIGVNFSAYVNTFRINKAKELLVWQDAGKMMELAAMPGIRETLRKRTGVKLVRKRTVLRKRPAVQRM